MKIIQISQSNPWPETWPEDIKRVFDIVTSRYSLSEGEIAWFSASVNRTIESGQTGSHPSPRIVDAIQTNMSELMTWSRATGIDFTGMQLQDAFDAMREWQTDEKVKAVHARPWLSPLVEGASRKVVAAISDIISLLGREPSIEEVMWILAQDENFPASDEVVEDIATALQFAKKHNIDLGRMNSLSSIKGLMKIQKAREDTASQVADFNFVNVVHQLSDGWRVVLVNDGTEGSYLDDDHPVGQDIRNEEYITDFTAQNYDSLLYSLRDKDGIPRLSIEVERDEEDQRFMRDEEDEDLSSSKDTSIQLISMSDLTSVEEPYFKEFLSWLTNNGSRQVKWNSQPEDIDDIKDFENFPGRKHGIVPYADNYGGSVDTYKENIQKIYEDGVDNYGFHPRGSTSDSIDSLVWYASARGEMAQLEEGLDLFRDDGLMRFYDYYDDYGNPWPDPDDYEGGEESEEYQKALEKYDQAKDEAYEDSSSAEACDAFEQEMKRVKAQMEEKAKEPAPDPAPPEPTISDKAMQDLIQGIEGEDDLMEEFASRSKGWYKRSSTNSR
jgi:hypothetical protein